MEKERKVLTVDEVAVKLGICSQLVRRQIKKGVIPCVKVGDRYLIPVVAFDYRRIRRKGRLINAC